MINAWKEIVNTIENSYVKNGSKAARPWSVTPAHLSLMRLFMPPIFCPIA